MVLSQLAFDSEQRDALGREYEVYRLLRSKVLWLYWVSLMILKVVALVLLSCLMQVFHLEPHQNRLWQSPSGEFFDPYVCIRELIFISKQ